MEIRSLTNSDFKQLLDLNFEMYKCIDESINYFQATNTLVHCINNTQGFLAIGLFEGEELKGFVTGFGQNEKVFHFVGIYVIMKNNEWTKKIIDFSFAHIEKLGYKGWEVDATNPNICSIMEKYGASVVYTRYHKEF